MRNLIGIIALSLLAATMGCSSESDLAETADAPISDNPFQALEENLSELDTPCELSSDLKELVVTVADGEVAIISKRAADSALVVNGYTCLLQDSAGAPTTVYATPASKTVTTVTVDRASGATTGATVIVDYTNGTFALQTKVTGTGITLNTIAADTLGIKGSTSADKITLVDGGVLATSSDALADIILGGATTLANTVVYLGDGADTFASSGGTADEPSIWAASDVDVYGGAGNDIFNQGTEANASETIHGGDGTDTLTYALRTTGVDLSDASEDTVADGLESIVGGEGDDVLVGDAGANTISGGLGNDTINGLAGVDILNGDAGDDVFQQDGINGINGVDAGIDTINGGAGTDTVDYSYNGDSGDATTLTAGFTINLTGVAGADVIKTDVENAIGTEFADIITGNTSANEITGGLGDDSLSGGDGNDTFHEGESVDLTGTDLTGSGADTIDGGAGVDAVDYSERVNDLTVTIGNSDTAGDDGESAEEDIIKGTVENVTGGDGDDSLTGSTSDNELVGGAGADTLVGSGGSDTFEGGAGTDQVTCGSGFDIVWGAEAEVDVNDDDADSNVTETWTSSTTPTTSSACEMNQ